MRRHDHTDMGGTREAFLTTHWSLIRDLQTTKDKDGAPIGALLKQYWKPVYCYLRRKGYDNERAKDLTQDFFHEVVLNRDLIGRADQDKGHFRPFLLHALNQYVINKNRDERAQKRIPRDRIVSLDATDVPHLPESFANVTAEDSYHYAWLSALLEDVVSVVEAKYSEQGKKIYWTLFEERVLQPILGSSDPPPLAQVCKKHGVDDVKKASNMIVTAKRFFRHTLVQHVRNTVMSEGQADEELQDLLQFLPGEAQRLP